MTIRELLSLIGWDVRMNRGLSFDQIRANLLLIEVRLEQYVYQRSQQQPTLPKTLFWYLCRFLGSIYQWFLCNANIPGSVRIGRGLRLPHPQNIIIARFADIGEFCIIYHNVSISWNAFKEVVPSSPKIGDKVLIGNGAIVIGDITIGDNVLIGAGAVVAKSVPSDSRVVCAPADVADRPPSPDAAKAGSARHIRDPYSVWR